MRTGAQAAHCLRSRLRKRRCAYMAIAAFIFMWTAMIMIYGYSRGSLRHVTRSLSPPLPPVAGNMTAQMLEIRAAASAAWRAYAATGMTGDDVRPLAGGAESSLRVRASLYDSLGTLFVMGLREEYEQAVAEVLRLGAPRTFIYQTSSFEYNIRVVGGLLSAAQLSGDRRLLVVAEEAAHTLLSSSYLLWPSPLPIGRVRMQPLTPLNFPVWLIARVMDVSWYLFERVFIGPQYCKLARIGSYSLELRALTLATGNKHYACTADAIQAHIMADAVHAPWPLGPEFHEGATGLHLSWDTLTGVGVTLPNGTVGNPSLGTGYDSFWEYLLKSHLMMPNDAPELYGGVYRKLAQQLAHEAQSSDSMQFIYTHANLLFLSHMASHRLHEHLGCYVPGLLMLGAHKLADRQGTYDMDTGLRLLDGCLWTYALHCDCCADFA